MPKKKLSLAERKQFESSVRVKVRRVRVRVRVRVNLVASACTRTSLSNTIYWGGGQVNRRQDKRQRSVECAKQGGGRLQKGG